MRNGPLQLPSEVLAWGVFTDRIVCEQFEGRVQQDDSREKLPQHPQEVVGRRSVVAKLFRGKLRRRTDCRYSPLHRAATNTAIGQRTPAASALSFPALKGELCRAA
jgi:hypothetical protein